MIGATNWPQLALLTVRDPKSAAEQILSWRLPINVLWLGVGFVTIINTILSSVSNFLIPAPEPFGALVASPFTFFVIVAGGFVLTAYAVFWAGRMLGGEGEFADLLCLMLWLQALRGVAQVILIAAQVLAPFLAGFIVLFVFVATLWILVNFISVALKLDSLVRAAMVLVAGGVALVFGLSLLFSVIGITAFGVSANV